MSLCFKQMTGLWSRLKFDAQQVTELVFSETKPGHGVGWWLSYDLWRLTGRIDSLWEERVQRVHAAGKTAIAVCMKQRPRLNKDGAASFQGRHPRYLQQPVRPHLPKQWFATSLGVELSFQGCLRPDICIVIHNGSKLQLWSSTKLALWLEATATRIT